MKPLLVALSLIASSHPAFARPKNSSVARALADSAGFAMAKVPEDQEVCFSPDEHCDWKLEKFIESAKESIDVAIYDINLDKLVHDLLSASAKKIKVRIIVDKKQAKGSHSLVPMMIKAGADVRYGHQRGIFHNKFTVVDGRMIETGSFNYTFHAATANNENQVYLSSPKIVARYRERFEKLWNEADEAK